MTPTELTSEQLEELKIGNSGAQALFVDLFLPDVTRWVLFSMRGREVDTKDVIQDTFIEALTSVEGLRDGGRLRHWMKRLTFNTVCRYFRRNQRDRTTELWEPDALECKLSAEPVSREMLREAFEFIKPQEAAIFYKRHVEGFRIDELAQIFCTSPSTIKRALASGRTRMRLRLESERRPFKTAA